MAFSVWDKECKAPKIPLINLMGFTKKRIKKSLNIG